MIFVLDIIGAAIVMAALALVPTYLYVRYQNRRLSQPKQLLLTEADDMKQQGDVNVLRRTLNQQRLCQNCEKITDPNTDLFINGRWAHVTCHKEIS